MHASAHWRQSGRYYIHSTARKLTCYAASVSLLFPPCALHAQTGSIAPLQSQHCIHGKLQSMLLCWQAALEEHGFKHVAEQLEQKAQEAAKEASPEEQVPAVDQAPQKAPPQAPADESMEDSERAAVAPDSDTGEGLEHLHAFNPVRSGAHSPPNTSTCLDIKPSDDVYAPDTSHLSST